MRNIQCPHLTYFDVFKTIMIVVIVMVMIITITTQANDEHVPKYECEYQSSR